MFPFPAESRRSRRRWRSIRSPTARASCYEVTRLVHDNAEIRSASTAAFLQRLAPTNKRDKRDRIVAGSRHSRSRAGTADRRDLEQCGLPSQGRAGRSGRRDRRRSPGVVAVPWARRARRRDARVLQRAFVDADPRSSSDRRRSFAAFSNSVRIRANRVIPPVATAPRRCGKAVVGEKVTRPDRFITQLFEQNDGRARVSVRHDRSARCVRAGRSRSACGCRTRRLRLERFKVLATTGVNAYREWHVRDAAVRPVVVRPGDDADARRGRRPRHARGSGVAWRSGRACSAATTVPDDRRAAGARSRRRSLRRGVADGSDRRRPTSDSASTGWIKSRSRSACSAGRADPGDVFVATRAVARYRMLMLTLERIGIRKPSLYAAAARQAARLGSLDGHRGFVALAQFQGAVALIARMTAVRTLRTATAEQLARAARVAAAERRRSLCGRGRAAGCGTRSFRDGSGRERVEATLIARAVRSAVGDRHGHASDVGGTALQARSRRGRAPPARDACARSRQDCRSTSRSTSPRIGRTLAADNLTAVRRCRRHSSRSPRSRRGSRSADGAKMKTSPSSRLAPAPEAQAILRKAARRSRRRQSRGKDVKRATRVAAPLLALSDDLLSQALLSFVYAVRSGRSRRHHPARGRCVAAPRFRIRPARTRNSGRVPRGRLPRQDVTPGLPWHVSGSLLGLDVALAPLALRRVSTDRVIARATADVESARRVRRQRGDDESV